MPRRVARAPGREAHREARVRSRVLPSPGPRKPKREAGDRRTKLSAPTFLVGSATSGSSRSPAFSRLLCGARRQACRQLGGPRKGHGRPGPGPTATGSEERAREGCERGSRPAAAGPSGCPTAGRSVAGPAQGGPAAAQTEASWRRRRRRGEAGLGLRPPRAPLQLLLPRAPTVTSPRAAVPHSALHPRAPAALSVPGQLPGCHSAPVCAPVAPSYSPAVCPIPQPSPRCAPALPSAPTLPCSRAITVPCAPMVPSCPPSVSWCTVVFPSISQQPPMSPGSPPVAPAPQRLSSQTPIHALCCVPAPCAPSTAHLCVPSTA